MENIISCVRIKPVKLPLASGGVAANKDWEEELVCGKVPSENSIMVYRSNEKYCFESVFDENTSTDVIFNNIGLPLVESCLDGINVCVFAYGQTSSGKTHTMRGKPSTPGFIPQAIKAIFAKMQVLQERGIDVELKVSSIEIYNESLNDLLNPSNKNLEIRENLQKGVHIPGLTESVVRNEFEAMECFGRGESQRIVAETHLNEESSRSHAVFRVSFEIRSRDKLDRVSYSTLSLVDLAGSEGVSRAKTEGLRKREGANINKSLLALSNVISRLASKDTSFINYRDSKLTRLLQPCLGGNSRTVVICTISPLLANFQETINTLKFGLSAGAVKNYVKVNERLSGQASASLSKSEQIKELVESREEVAKVRNSLDVSRKREEDLEKQALILSDELEKRNREVIELKEERDKLLTKLLFEQRNSKSLRTENEQILELLKDVEKGTQRLFKEHKMNEIQEMYSNLEQKAAEVEAINEKLKAANSELRSECMNRDDRIRDLEKRLATLQREKENVMVIEPKLTPKLIIQQAPQPTPIALPVHQSRIMRNIGGCMGEPDLEMHDLELSSSLNSRLIQKNAQLNDLQLRLNKITAELHKKDERLYELESKAIEIRTNTLITPSRDPLEIAPTSGLKTPRNGGGLAIIEESNRKRLKLEGEYDYVTKRINNSPSKDELKKEVAYLKARNKNLQSFVDKRKNILDDYTQKMQELLGRNLDLENKLLYINANSTSVSLLKDLQMI